MANTPEYTRKAVDNYRKKFDIMQLRLPKGTRDRIEKQADKAHDFVVDCVLAELERLEAQEEPTGQQETYQTKQDQKQEKEEAKPTNNNTEANSMTLEEAQALLDRKRAEQKEWEEMIEKAKQERKEQEEAKEREEISKIIDRIIGVDDTDDNSAKI